MVRLLVSYFKLDIDNTKLDDFQSNHPNYFKQSSNEGILTQIEDNLTREEYLAQCFIKLNLDWNWILDDNQINQKDDQKTSVQSNILEAIVGAIALDSKFDNNLILSVVTKFLDFDQFMDNYHEVKPNFIGKLQEWSSKSNLNNEYKLPKYDPENGKDIGNTQNVECKVTIMIENQLKTFSASSTSYSSAKYEVAKIACQYLRKKGYISW